MSDGELRLQAPELPLRAPSGTSARSHKRGSRSRLPLLPAALAFASGLLVAWVGIRSGTHLRRGSSGQDAAIWSAIVICAGALAIYAWESRPAGRMGHLALATGLLSALWLLQASGDSMAFSIGWLLAGLVVPALCYAMLASPAGVLARRPERMLVIGSLGVPICWAALTASSRQPGLLAPLIRCAPACPRNALFIGSLPDAAGEATRGLLLLAWLLVAFGGVGLLGRRFLVAGAAGRRRVGPMLLASTAYLLAVALFFVLHTADSRVGVPLGWLSVASATAVSLAMLLGLGWERLFMGEALETFVGRLAQTAPEDIPALIAQTPAAPSPWPSSAHAGGGESHAVRERFLRAAEEAALISLRNHRLEAELTATVQELAASRRRLLESANVERQRIERDLHDGVQQHIVGMRVKLELTREALEGEPDRGREMLAEIGRAMDEALSELRSLAQGVYPPLLREYGPAEALKSAGRRSPCPVSVFASGHGRYALDTEAAVYFCCLEALQNVAKHAGLEARATVRLWEDRPLLRFEVSDSGAGFEPARPQSGRGLVNMHDRVAAVGGRLSVRSGANGGTVVSGSVPIPPPSGASRAGRSSDVRLGGAL